MKRFGAVSGLRARLLALLVHRPVGRMSLPDQMSDRWQNRPEPAPDEAVVSWHMLMRDYPEVVDLVRQAQQRLAGLDGLHMTPLHWLHMTTLLAGPAADFSPASADGRDSR
jgi:hypothetical protein